MNYTIKALSGVLAVLAGILALGTQPVVAALAFAAAAFAFAPLKREGTK